MKKFVVDLALLCVAAQGLADQAYIGCSKWGWTDTQHAESQAAGGWWNQMLTGYDYGYNAGFAATGYVQIDLSSFNPTLNPGESLTINFVQLDLWEYTAGWQWTAGTPYAQDLLYTVADWTGNITTTNYPALGTQIDTLNGSLPWAAGADADAKIIANSAATQAYILGELAGDKIVSFGLHAPAGTDIKSWHGYQTGPGSMRVTVDYTIVPEPATMAILGLGALLFARKRA